MGSTKTLSIHSILSCLELIERKMPPRPNFSFYEPTSTFDPTDINSLHRETKRMMEFVGLGVLTPIVTICDKEEGVAGSINLNNEKIVYIDLDKTLFQRLRAKYAILGVLAHEICHKYLFVNGLFLQDIDKNEICTDIATFFVGFNYLTLNGCNDSGYLTPESYLLTHAIVCKINNVQGDIYSNVHSGILFLNNQPNVSFIQNIDISSANVIKKFEEQSSIAARKRRNITILRNLLKQEEDSLLDTFEKNDSRFSKLLVKPDWITRFPYKALLALSQTKSFEEDENFSILSFLNTNLNKQDCVDKLNESLNRPICPFCGTDESTALIGTSIRRCSCGKIFFWDAEPYVIPAPEEAEPEEKPSEEPTVIQKEGFFRRIIHYFKK